MTLLEAANGMFGAWRLLHFDRTGLQYFGTNPRAFWNSFWAAAIVVPGEAIGVMLLGSADQPDINTADPLHALFVFIALYGLFWLLFPLVMSTITETMQRGERFVLFIVAWNWARVVRLAILLPALVILSAEGTSTPGWGVAIYAAATMFSLIYAGFVARAALDTTRISAGMVVAVEIGLFVSLWIGANALTA